MLTGAGAPVSVHQNTPMALQTEEPEIAPFCRTWTNLGYFAPQHQPQETVMGLAQRFLPKGRTVGSCLYNPLFSTKQCTFLLLMH